MQFYYLLIILLLNGCVNNKKEQEKIVELQSIIKGIQNKDYNVLDKFLTNQDISPYIIVQDGYILGYDTSKPIDIGIGVFTLLSNKFTPLNKGEVIAYTNKYGVIIYNTNKILISQEEWNQSVPEPTYGFSDSMNMSFTTTNLQEIIYVYNRRLYSSSIYIAPDRSYDNIREYIKNHYSVSSEQNNILREGTLDDELYHYIYQKTFPVNDSKALRIALLNHWAYLLYSNFLTKSTNVYYVPQYPL